MPEITPGDRWWDLIEERAALTPDLPMLEDERARRLTFAGFREAAERVAAGLLGLGVQSGMTVSWQLPTVMEAAVLMAALSRLDVVQNPIIPILRDAEVGYMVAQLEADLLVTPGVWRGFDYAAMAARICATTGTRTLVVDHTGIGHNGIGPGELALPSGDPGGLPKLGARSPDEVRWILYSSGTTAAPKGARHSDRSVMAGSNGIVDNIGVDGGDVVPIAFPITHVGGSAFLSAQLRVGCRLLLIEVFDAERSPLVMAEHGATVLGSAPPFFHAYLASQRARGPERLFPNLRMGVSGGAPSPPELHFEVKRELGGAGIVSGWGLTEFPIATEASASDSDGILAETVGRASPGVSIRVTDSDGSDLGAGHEGELRVRGDQMCLGYVDSELDAEAFDEKGYFRTGDLGTVDPAGYVRVTGRMKDIIIRNAENISATAVENVLYLHPRIADVAVVGIPDPRTGERCCAAVVLTAEGGPVTLAEIADHCRAEGLAAQRIPERLDIFDSLPRNAMGKLLKQEIRAEVLSRAGGAGGA
jgi:acyl-CoA synthetase (AMP-forming)/AMP-acid ligase II